MLPCAGDPFGFRDTAMKKKGKVSALIELHSIGGKQSSEESKSA